MSWVELFTVLVVSHTFGDYVLQTNWQAMNKHGGLGADRISRRALTSHLAVYSLTFVPALIWLADERGAAAALASGLAIARRTWSRTMVACSHATCGAKKIDASAQPLPALLADQALHALALLAVALVVAT